MQENIFCFKKIGLTDMVPLSKYQVKLKDQSVSLNILYLNTSQTNRFTSYAGWDQKA